MAENKETKGFIQVYKSTNTVPCEPWFAPADAEIAKQVNQLKDDVANGKVSDEALNQQLGTLVGIVSQGAIAQQASQPSTDDKVDTATESDGGAK